MAKKPTREEAERMADKMTKNLIVTDPLLPLPKKKAASKTKPKKAGKK